MSGLSREHHGELNRLQMFSSRYNELRKQYAGDSLAQQQIDAYEPGTEYQIHLRWLVSAIKRRDVKAEAILDEWFTENYPDLRR